MEAAEDGARRDAGDGCVGEREGSGLGPEPGLRGPRTEGAPAQREGAGRCPASWRAGLVASGRTPSW